MDKETALGATDHGGHPNCRNQIPPYLYDDFEFYRGLIGDLVHWAAAEMGSQQDAHVPPVLDEDVLLLRRSRQLAGPADLINRKHASIAHG